MKFVIIKAKKWQNGIGTYPNRIVLTAKINESQLEQSSNNTIQANEFTTHRQIDATQDNNTIFLATGHYYTNIIDAEKDFKTRS